MVEYIQQTHITFLKYFFFVTDQVWVSFGAEPHAFDGHV